MGATPAADLAGVTDRLRRCSGRAGEWRARLRDLVPLDADRLAVEAARRDPRRFEALYRKYVAQVYSFALYETRDHHAAEDLTEQVFLRALRALPRFDERGADEGSTFRVVAVPHRPQRPRQRAAP